MLDDGNGGQFENPVNQWYQLGYDNGYTDIFYTQTSTTPYGGETVSQDWCWVDENGVQVAHSDLDFRENIMPGLMNRFNREAWDELDSWVEVAPIIGLDFYHYKRDFWFHGYANYILPYHRYIKGDERASYLNRNNWGKGGLILDNELEQWSDYSAGLSFGTKIGKNFGIFVEGEFTKMWDRPSIFNTDNRVILKLSELGVCSITLDLKTIGLIVVGLSSLIGMWFALQADIDEAKTLPLPEIQRIEFQMKDEAIREAIMNTVKDVEEIKNQLNKIDERLYELQTR